MGRHSVLHMALVLLTCHVDGLHISSTAPILLRPHIRPYLTINMNEDGAETSINDDEVAAAAPDEAPAAEERKLSPMAKMRQQTEGGGAATSSEGGIGIPKAESILPSSGGLINIGIFLIVAAGAAVYISGQV